MAYDRHVEEGMARIVEALSAAFTPDRARVEKAFKRLRPFYVEDI